MDEIVLGYLRGIAGLRHVVLCVSGFNQNDTKKSSFGKFFALAVAGALAEMGFIEFSIRSRKFWQCQSIKIHVSLRESVTMTRAWNTEEQTFIFSSVDITLCQSSF